MKSLDQNKIYLGYRRFEFRDNNTLEIEHKNWRHHLKYMIDVVALSDKCGHRVAFSRRAILLFILLLTLTLLLFILQGINALADITAIKIGSYVFIALCVAALGIIIYTTRHERVFKTRHSKVPVIWFYNNLPDKNTCQNFIQYMQERIQTRSEFLGLNEQQQSAGELKTLRRLFENNVIKEEEYESAKKKLLTLSDKSVATGSKN